MTTFEDIITVLKEGYAHLFEDDLLAEINQVETFKDVPTGHKLMGIEEYAKSI